MNDDSTIRTVAQVAELTARSVENFWETFLKLFQGNAGDEVVKWFEEGNSVCSVTLHNPPFEFIDKCINEGIPIKIMKADENGNKANNLENLTIGFRSCDKDKVEALLNELYRNEDLEEDLQKENILDETSQYKMDGLRTCMVTDLNEVQASVIQRTLSKKSVRSLCCKNVKTGLYDIEIPYDDMNREFQLEYEQDGEKKYRPCMNAVEESMCEMAIIEAAVSHKGIADDVNRIKVIEGIIAQHYLPAGYENTHEVPVHYLIDPNALDKDYYILEGNSAKHMVRGKYDPETSYPDLTAPGAYEEFHEKMVGTITKEKFMYYKEKDDESFEAFCDKLADQVKKNRVNVVDKYFNSRAEMEDLHKFFEFLRDNNLLFVDFRSNYEQVKDEEGNLIWVNKDDPQHTPVSNISNVQWTAREIRIADTAEVMEVLKKTNQDLPARLKFATSAVLAERQEEGGPSAKDISDEDLIRNYLTVLRQKLEEIKIHNIGEHITRNALHPDGRETVIVGDVDIDKTLEQNGSARDAFLYPESVSRKTQRLTKESILELIRENGMAAEFEIEAVNQIKVNPESGNICLLYKSGDEERVADISREDLLAGCEVDQDHPLDQGQFVSVEMDGEDVILTYKTISPGLEGIPKKDLDHAAQEVGKDIDELVQQIREDKDRDDRSISLVD